MSPAAMTSRLFHYRQRSDDEILRRRPRAVRGKAFGISGVALDDAHQVLYFVGNNDQNEMRLYKLDLKTKKKTVLYKGTASADSLFLSKDLTHIYFRLGKADEDIFRLASFDLKTKRYENLYPAADEKDDSVA